MNVNKKFLVIFLLFALNLYLFANDVNLNKFARDYIKSSLIINYYSEGRPLYKTFDIYSRMVFPKPGFKYVVEIKPIINSFKQLKELELFEYYFDFSYTSDSSIWNSYQGTSNVELKKLLNCYKKDITNPNGLLEVNILHKKGIIAKTSNGDLFIVNNNENMIEGLTSVSKEKYEVENIKEVILLRYFHYSPEQIEISIQNSNFTFYSNSLSRYFKGELIYNAVKNIYIAKLENGVLIND